MISIEELMSIANKSQASDVHITVGVPPKMRVNGELVNMNFPILTADDTKNILSKIMNQSQIKCYEQNGEVTFSFSLSNISRCRANIYRQRGAMTGALRLVSTCIPKANELGIPESVVQLYQKKRGLILVTGPASSGKSTTLAALIDLINEETNSHIIILEDPIEYLHHHKNSMVNQREIGIDTNSYADALREALREDPDVILVGEMRDVDTITIAITAAQTGHLVLSTLDTMGVANTIDQIINTFPPHQQHHIRLQLAAVLETVITQQLIPSADTSYRVPVFEVMHRNTAIRNLIIEDQTHQIPLVIELNKQSGMLSMDNEIYELFLQGKITAGSAIQYALDMSSMENRVKPIP